MKTPSLSLVGFLFAALMPLSGGTVSADEVVAKVNFNGTLNNRPTKQSIRGKFRGKGEYGRFDLNVDLSGTVLSQPNTRTPQRNLMGKYPVEIDLRVSKSGIAASDSFGANVHVRRRSIRVSDVGTIHLNRPIRPTKLGVQRVSGKGTLRYDF